MSYAQGHCQTEASLEAVRRPNRAGRVCPRAMVAGHRSSTQAPTATARPTSGRVPLRPSQRLPLQPPPQRLGLAAWGLARLYFPL